jgi:hypothetical protein
MSHSEVLAGQRSGERRVVLQQVSCTCGAGAAGGVLPGGTLALLRNLAGMTGDGVLAAVALGGAFGWIGPMAYWLATGSVLAAHWTTPWIWPA